MRRSLEAAKCGGSAARLEPLGQPGEESAAQPELRIAHPDPRTVADLIDLVEEIEDIEPQFEPLVDPGIDRLDDAEIDLLIARQTVPVGNGSVGGSKTAAGDQIERKTECGSKALCT